jgi:hypothetical protein
MLADKRSLMKAGSCALRELTSPSTTTSQRLLFLPGGQVVDWPWPGLVCSGQIPVEHGKYRRMSFTSFSR